MMDRESRFKTNYNKGRFSSIDQKQLKEKLQNAPSLFNQYPMKKSEKKKKNQMFVANQKWVNSS